MRGNILIFGDALSRIDKDSPFTSKSGYLYRKFLSEAGLSNLIFDNVCDEIPVEDLSANRNYFVPTWYYQAHKKKFLERLSGYDISFIIPCGEIALKTLFPDEKLKQCFGYELDYNGIPVMPIDHPHQIMVERSNLFWTKQMLRKAARLIDGTHRLKPVLHFNNDANAFIDALQRVKDNKLITSMDIETSIERKPNATPKLRSIGFSSCATEAFAIDTNAVKFREALALYNSVISDPSIMKIGQNISFDFQVMWKNFGVIPAGRVWDTMHAANMLYAEIEKSLGDLGRLYLHERYWKGDHMKSGPELLRYNALDCIYTHVIAGIQRTELEEEGMRELFEEVNTKLFVPAFNMSIRGIAVDEGIRESMRGELKAIIEPLVEETRVFANPLTPLKKAVSWKRTPDLDKEVKIPSLVIPSEKLKKVDEVELLSFHMPLKQAKLHYIKDGKVFEKASEKITQLVKQEFNPKSHVQVKAVYKNAGVNLPQDYKKKSEDKGTTNADALRKIIARNTDTPEVLKFTSQLELLRNAFKLESSYLNADLCPDNRWRCTYNIEGARSGRSSSKKTTWNTGGNNQNLPRDPFRGIKFKKCFVADPGYQIVQFDQSAAESRIVAYMAECEPMIDVINSGGDIHLFTLSKVYDEDFNSLTKADPRRQKVKPIGHGANYGASAATIVSTLLKAGTIITVAEADEMLKKYMLSVPEIAANFHARIRQDVDNAGYLVTPFGRKRYFFGKKNMETYREAYSYIPQSMVPHITNLVWLKLENMVELDFNVLYMGHDSLVAQVRGDQVEQYIQQFYSLAQTITFDIGKYRDLVMPWDHGIGPSLGEIKE